MQVENDKVSGFMIKKARKKNIFHFRLWYDRYFVITPQYLSIYRGPGKKISQQIPAAELYKITNISGPEEKTQCPYKYSFVLETKSRSYQLYCPTQKEREIWIKSFQNILKVEIIRN